MNQKDIRNICLANGYDFSIPKIYRYGLREGFLIETNSSGKEKYTVDMDKLNKWLQSGSIPEGYMALRDAVKTYGISFYLLKYHLNADNKEILKKGIGGDNVFYAKTTDIESVIAKCNEHSKKEKSNE